MNTKYDHENEKTKFYVSLIFTVLVYGSILFGLAFANPIMIFVGIMIIMFLIFTSVFIRLIDEIIPPPKVA